MGFIVHRPGLASRIVDGGRPGHRGLGVPIGGAADQEAWSLGNALLGNPPDAPALELLAQGPVLEATELHLAVVWGGGFGLSVRGRPWPLARSFTVAPGDSVAISGSSAATCGYLCVRHGFTVPEVLGSRSGLTPIVAESTLQAKPSQGLVALADVPVWEGLYVPLRVLPGSHADSAAWEGLLGTRFTVSPASNRMGVRLAGPALPTTPQERVSAPVCPGTIQLPADGLPIVLGRDAQTIGGYPRLAHVVAADLDRLARFRSGDTVRFMAVDAGEAQELARARARWLRRWVTRLRLAAALWPGAEPLGNPWKSSGSRGLL